MDRSVSLPAGNGYVSNGVSRQAIFKTAMSMRGSSLLRKKVSWVPDTVDNEDVTKKSFKKETYVSASHLVSSSVNRDGVDSEIGEAQSF